MSQAHVLGYIASVNADMGQIQPSIEAALAALSLAKGLEDHRLAGEQQSLLAFNYYDLDENEKAIQYCTAALESFKNIDDQVMVQRAQRLLDELSNPSFDQRE